MEKFLKNEFLHFYYNYLTKMAAVDSAEFLVQNILRKMNRLQEILALIGLAYTTKVSIQFTWNLMNGIRTHFISKLWKINLVEKYGKWAVITGCTEGIGKAYAEEFASRGLNLILISRSLDKLHALAYLLEAKYGIQVLILQADFSQGKQVYEKITTELRTKDIGILVNNVGIMSEYPDLFGRMSEEMIWKMIMINVGAVTMMTHIILPGMLQRGRGAIINLSSSCSIRPLPLMAVYSATKAYINYFTASIQYEYKNRGVDFQCLMPFYVLTAMTKKFSKTINQLSIVPDARSYVQSSLSTLGVASSTTGYWVHGVQYVVTSNVYDWVWFWLGSLWQRKIRKGCQVKQS